MRIKKIHKILTLFLRITKKNENHRNQQEKHEIMKIIEFHKRITIFMKILEFQQRIMKIMKVIEYHKGYQENNENLRIPTVNQSQTKILEFQARIMKIMKIIEFQYENHENYENL